MSTLNSADREIRDYKKKYEDLLSKLDMNVYNELASLKEKCKDYQKKLNNANYENTKCKQDISSLQAKIKELKVDCNQNGERLNLESTNDSENQNEDDKVYHIRNIVKKHTYYMDKVYCSKSDFFHSFKKDESSNEYKMYKLLLSVIYEMKSESLINTDGECIRLSLFSQVRLADIVELQCSAFDKFKNDPYRKSICGMIEGNKPNFDNEDYKKAFLHPLLNQHICPRNVPIAVSKTDNFKIFAPEVNQKADAWLIQYRKFHDLWIKNNALKAVRVCSVSGE